MIKHAEISVDSHIANSRNLKDYYKLHAGIYNMTRWIFLFGRDKIIQEIGTDLARWHILEIGCGTGHNLKILKKYFPEAKITGIDISEEMLKVAADKLDGQLELVNRIYSGPIKKDHFDLVVCSYTLSMIPKYQDILEAVKVDLRPGGLIVVVDFHGTRWQWFRKWMGFNHVCMEEQLRPELEKRFQPIQNIIVNAYGCFWQYLMFIGKK